MSNPKQEIAELKKQNFELKMRLSQYEWEAGPTPSSARIKIEELRLELAKYEERYDYYYHVKADLVEAINNWLEDEPESVARWKASGETLRNYLSDILWCSDDVTGNGSGSYTLNTWWAEVYTCHNQELYAEAVAEIGEPKNPEYAESKDVCIRCYVFKQVLDDAIRESNVPKCCRLP